MTAPTRSGSEPGRNNWHYIAIQRSDAGMGPGIICNPLVGLDNGKLVTFPLPEGLYQVVRIGQMVDDPREWCNGLVIIGVDVPSLDTIPDELHGDDLDAHFQKHQDMVETEALNLLGLALKHLQEFLAP